MNAEPAEVVGIIYSSETADTVYGRTTEHIEIDSSVLSSIISLGDAYIMFYIKDGVMIIADAHRNALHPQDAEFSSDTIFHYFSTEKLVELLNIGDAPETSIELRRDVLSITNGSYTLENAKPCPPYCP